VKRVMAKPHVASSAGLGVEKVRYSFVSKTSDH
jgi:hypothetical protein